MCLHHFNLWLWYSKYEENLNLIHTIFVKTVTEFLLQLSQGIFSITQLGGKKKKAKQ